LLTAPSSTTDAKVRSFFGEDGGLKPSATQKQLLDGLAWACEFGRSRVVELLFENGVKADAILSRVRRLSGGRSIDM
jgi:hypothetical protein